MDWLIETLRVLREVRDWTDRRAVKGPRSLATRTAVHRATAAAETEVATEPVVVQRIGPAPSAPAPSNRTNRRTPRIPLGKVDPNAVSVVRRLKRNKHKAYLVGGCVRDLLLGLEPKDFDIATDASPEQVKAIFRNSRIIGRRFRLVHLYFRGGYIIEVSTFRASVTNDDSEDADLLIRRDNVYGSEEEDALRRDFTINGLFYDVTTSRIIDHVDGLRDVEERYLRMIGDPEIRLREDPIRILRAIRFKAKTNVQLDPALLASMIACRDEIKRCAPARVLEETMRLLRIGFAEETVRLMHETGVLEVLFPMIHEFLVAEGPVRVDVGPAGEDANFVDVDRLALVLQHLKALDDIKRREGEVSDSVALAALIAAPLAVALDAFEEAGGDRNRALTDWLTELGEQTALTKRMHEQLRQIFMAQRHMTRRTGFEKRRRRRISPAVLMRRGFFEDALRVFEIVLIGNGQPMDELEEWRALASGASAPTRAERERMDAEPKRKRRRRSGRRRPKPAEEN